jgi:hypothetical protein
MITLGSRGVWLSAEGESRRSRVSWLLILSPPATPSTARW